MIFFKRNPQPSPKAILSGANLILRALYGFFLMTGTIKKGQNKKTLSEKLEIVSDNMENGGALLYGWCEYNYFAVVQIFTHQKNRQMEK